MIKPEQLFKKLLHITYCKNNKCQVHLGCTQIFYKYLYYHISFTVNLFWSCIVRNVWYTIPPRLHGSLYVCYTCVLRERACYEWLRVAKCTFPFCASRTYRKSCAIERPEPYIHIAQRIMGCRSVCACFVSKRSCDMHDEIIRTRNG